MRGFVAKYNHGCKVYLFTGLSFLFARRVYPELGTDAVIFDIATPQTYQRFGRRPDGAVGGVRQTMKNSNLYAVPQDIGIKGFYIAGDY